LSDPHVRVLIVGPWGERAGGAEEMLWTILRNLNRSMVEPEVGFLSDGPFVAEVTSLGIQTGRLRNPLAYANAVRELGVRLRHSNASVVVAWSAKTHLYLGIARLLFTRRRRSAWWQHALPSPGHWIDKLATLIPTTEVGCSSQASAAAQRLLRPQRPTFVVYPGVDPGKPGDRAAVRASLGIDPEAWVVGTVGRLQPRKGQDKVIRAVAKLRARGVPAAALIVGGTAFGLSETYPCELRELARDIGVAEHTTFTGQVDSASPFHAAMDVFVNATHGEAFGIAIVEAMAAGLPVVAFASGGPTEIIETGASGILVSSDGDLVEALAMLATDSDLSDQVKRGAVARARAFDSKRSAESFARWAIRDERGFSR
jgi:glycosyltransferase involved in cell wall biosynthesis